MSDQQQKPEVGTVGWMDLTVSNADEVRDFYQSVVGWQPSGVDMGGYNDWTMETPKSLAPTAGVCNARGSNADLPPIWLIYITVEDLDQSIARCEAMGGRVISGPKTTGGHGRYCVIEDPAGAAAGLFEHS